jgi:hypothetical protein
LQLCRKFRIPALFCALAVLACELIARPFTTMGVVDDGPYILMTRNLASTGHLVYNGWPAAMLGLQLYLGAAFIKLFGFSFTTVRMSTLFIAVLTAFFLQRTLVRSGITERNATIGTLTLVLSPLYCILSVTFMTDIFGLFAIVVCLYGCLRALQSSSDRSAILWLCFAVVTNALVGTSRQIAWLGILVMAPSTLWLLRPRRRVLLSGTVVTLAGVLFILACVYWFRDRAYIQPEHLLPDAFPLPHILWELIYSVLDAAFLLLPIVALFLAEVRRTRLLALAITAVCLLGYIFIAIHPSHLRGTFPLEPIPKEIGEWVNVDAIFQFLLIKGEPPHYLHTGMQILLTLVSFGGLLGLFASFFRPRLAHPSMDVPSSLTWKQLALLLLPFSIAYTLLLVPRAATTGIHDRYLLGLLVVALIFLVRYYQERAHDRLPIASMVLVALVAIYSIAVVHNFFSFYRARVALASELRAAGVPDTSVNNGWEYNFVVELQHAPYLNDSRIVLPANAYVPQPPLPAGTCPMIWYEKTPHIHPLYGVSFDPDACYGLAPFAPVHYSRWPYRTPGTLYVVRYVPAAKP